MDFDCLKWCLTYSSGWTKISSIAPPQPIKKKYAICFFSFTHKKKQSVYESPFNLDQPFKPPKPPQKLPMSRRFCFLFFGVGTGGKSTCVFWGGFHVDVKSEPRFSLGQRRSANFESNRKIPWNQAMAEGKSGEESGHKRCVCRFLFTWLTLILGLVSWVRWM